MLGATRFANAPHSFVRSRQYDAFRYFIGSNSETLPQARIAQLSMQPSRQCMTNDRRTPATIRKNLDAGYRPPLHARPTSRGTPSTQGALDPITRHAFLASVSSAFELRTLGSTRWGFEAPAFR